MASRVTAPSSGDHFNRPPLDLERRREELEARVAQKPYPYQTKD